MRDETQTRADAGWGGSRRPAPLRLLLELVALVAAVVLGRQVALAAADGVVRDPGFFFPAYGVVLGLTLTRGRRWLVPFVLITTLASWPGSLWIGLARGVALASGVLLSHRLHGLPAVERDGSASAIALRVHRLWRPLVVTLVAGPAVAAAGLFAVSSVAAGSPPALALLESWSGLAISALLFAPAVVLWEVGAESLHRSERDGLVPLLGTCAVVLAFLVMRGHELLVTWPLGYGFAAVLLLGAAVWGSAPLCATLSTLFASLVAIGYGVLPELARPILEERTFVALTSDLALVCFVALVVLVVRSELLQRQESLRAQGRLLATVVDSIPGAVILQDGSGRVLFANRFLHRLLDAGGDGEIDAHRLAAAGFASRPLVEVPAAGRAAARVTWKDGEIEVGDGVTLPVLQTRLPVLDEEGTRYLTIALDATERRRAERAAQATQAELAVLLRSIPGTVLKVSDDHRVLLSSSADDDPRIGSPLRDWVVEEDSGRVLAAIESAGSGNRTSLVEVRRAEPPHERVELRVTRNRVDGGSGGYTVVVTNVESLREAERVRRDLEHEMQRMARLESLGFLAGSVAHDFNNLLTGIAGNTELAAMESNDPSVLRHLEDVQTGAQRAAELCRQLLAYAGRGELEVGPLDLSQVVREIVGPMQPRLAAGARVEIELADGLPAVEGDAIRIQQVVMNLMANASDALQEGRGTVRVCTALRWFEAGELDLSRLSRPLPEGEYVVVTVSDDGEGIASELLPRIFEPFYSTKDQGTGLGLAAAHGLVHSQGGAIQVESRPGAGTRFELLFPARRDLDLALAAGTREIVPRRGRVLVVDGEVLVRDLAKVALGKVGFEVLQASDGFEAAALLERLAAGASGPRRGESPPAGEVAEPAAAGGAVRPPRPVDCILLDLTLPRLSGSDLLSLVKRKMPDVPVVLMSGYSQERLGRAMRKLPFLAKPFKAGELVRAVHAACRGEATGEAASGGRGSAIDRPPLETRSS